MLFPFLKKVANASLNLLEYILFYSIYSIIYMICILNIFLQDTYSSYSPFFLFKLQDAAATSAFFFAGRSSSDSSASNEMMGACSAVGNAVDPEADEALGAMAVATSTHGDEGTANGFERDFYGFLVCRMFSKC